MEDTLNVLDTQRKKLIDLMEQHEDLRNDRFSSTSTELQRGWEEVATELNSLADEHRDWRQWRKIWQDLRSQVEKKYREIKRINGSDTSLTEEEASLMRLLLNSSGTSTDSVLTDSEPETDDFDHDTIVTESTSRSAVPERNVVPAENIHGFGSRTETLPSVSGLSQQRTSGQSSRRRTIIMCSNICRRKLSIKKHYYEQKLRLMAREVRAKERIAAALELIVNRNFSN